MFLLAFLQLKFKVLVYYHLQLRGMEKEDVTLRKS